MQLPYVAIPDKFHAEGVGFLAAATTTASKIPLYTPKISFDSRPTNPALLPLLFKGQYETISVSAIFLWMKKAHRAKIVRIAKVFPCEVFFAKQNRLILKELRGRFSKRGFFGNEVQKPFVARRGARARHDGKLRLVADMGAHIEIFGDIFGDERDLRHPAR